MPKYYILIILTFVLCGCSTTIRVINPHSPSDLEKLPKGKTKVNITTTDRQKIPAVKLQVNPDSAAWYNPSLRQYQTVATAEIQEIVHDQRRIPATIGVLVGIPVGAIIGTTIGTALSEPQDDSFVSIPTGAVIGFFAGIFGGAMVGAIAGGEMDYKTIFQFQKTTTESAPDTLTKINTISEKDYNCQLAIITGF
jgi:hypothetical protein